MARWTAGEGLDWLQRGQALWTVWGFIKPFIVPAMSGAGLGGWTARITHWPLPVILIVCLAGFGAVLLVMNQLAFRRKLATLQLDGRRDKGSIENAPMPLLAWHYMTLTLLNQHVQRMIEVEQLTDEPPRLDLYPMEVALDKLRRDLMNLSPSVFPTATAIDFQPPPPHEGYVDVRERLPKAIDGLMKKVLSHWHRYSDQAKTKQ